MPVDNKTRGTQYEETRINITIKNGEKYTIIGRETPDVEMNLISLQLSQRDYLILEDSMTKESLLIMKDEISSISVIRD